LGRGSISLTGTVLASSDDEMREAEMSDWSEDWDEEWTDDSSEELEGKGKEKDRSFGLL
jgi:hypothetical protein